MMKPKKRNVSKKIKRQLWFFVFMFFLFIFLSIRHFIQDSIPLKYPIFAFLIGIILGAILSRIQNVTWDNKGHQIVKDIDMIGGILLILLILLNIFKRKIVYEFVHLEHISAITFSLSAGIMLGRVFTIRHQIIEILIDKGLREKKE